MWKFEYGRLLVKNDMTPKVSDLSQMLVKNSLSCLESSKHSSFFWYLLARQAALLRSSLALLACCDGFCSTVIIFHTILCESSPSPILNLSALMVFLESCKHLAGQMRSTYGCLFSLSQIKQCIFYLSHLSPTYTHTHILEGTVKPWG